jgi:hypothetical protein
MYGGVVDCLECPGMQAALLWMYGHRCFVVARMKGTDRSLRAVLLHGQDEIRRGTEYSSRRYPHVGLLLSIRYYY